MDRAQYHIIWFLELEIPLLLIWQDVNFKSFKKEFSAKELEFFVSGLLECIFFSRPSSTFGFDKYVSGSNGFKTSKEYEKEYEISEDKGSSFALLSHL